MVKSRRKRKRIADQKKVNKQNEFKQYMKNLRISMEDTKFDIEQHVKTL